MKFKEFFVVHAGKYNDLPRSELIGSLEAVNGSFLLKHGTKYLSRFISEERVAREATKRLALSKFLCEEIIFKREEINNIFSDIQKINLNEGGSFFVRVNRVEGSLNSEAVVSLERKIGEIISSKFKKKVSFKDPEEIFILHVEKGTYAFGKFLEFSERKNLKYRQNNVKPRFHSSMLPPDLSRALVNLARVKNNDVFLDPFCGMGGLLIEALLLGAKAIGVDFKKRMLDGAKENLDFFGLFNYELIMGDARFLPILKADCVATDLPYGKLSPKVKEKSMLDLFVKFIVNLRNVVKIGGHVAMIFPKGFEIEKLMEENGFFIISRDEIFVNDVLTRVFIASVRVN